MSKRNKVILAPYDTQSKFHDKVFWAAVIALSIATALGGVLLGNI
jgi:hypothetical protein